MRGLSKADKDETSYRRPTDFVRRSPSTDGDVENDDEVEELGQLSLPPIGEKKEGSDTTAMHIALADKKDKPIEKKTSTILPRIIQSSTRRSNESFSETAVKIYQRDEKNEDPSLHKKEMQDKER